ncbi:aminotransferase class V-fold PLP-dependent enzyme [Subtercola sp. PAMC28395]|uniref:kynureninase n=1 Tax=Subtercola sp. PAMC28395 TaxID=2846775 RepID=UPI001C0AEEB9|nr:aminotransferase class V-fold PLP-dependent enzyme [Subtercola sp. PAMC28395]QWT22718.1 aminotransferase class V-fold PLP-dependent enzyme [Subtercola sp. PAMC28395]
MNAETTANASSVPRSNAGALDRADPLASLTSRFVESPEVTSYLDGNSLGRPLRVTSPRLTHFIEQDWGSRLIRSWDEEWFERPLTLGDRLGALVLGAGEGQTVIADSTTVMLYKLIRAAVGARPTRTEIVLDDDNFPTDRFLVEGIARECGLTIRWISVDRDSGVTRDHVAAVVSERTALVLLSHVSYRSAFLADMQAITEEVHSAGALVLWDLCHSAGVVPTELDHWGVDLAVGCTYKYLNGGPGSPAFGYVAKRLQHQLEQPIWGWMGAQDVFGMREEFEPAHGMRRFISGTPPVLAMMPMCDMLDLIEEAGLPAIRNKSIALTEFVISLAEELLVPEGASIATPRSAAERGSHVMIRHERFRDVIGAAWVEGIIPDFRNPDGLRIGLSPLSTSFEEVSVGMHRIREILATL